LSRRQKGCACAALALATHAGPRRRTRPALAEPPDARPRIDARRLHSQRAAPRVSPKLCLKFGNGICWHEVFSTLARCGLIRIPHTQALPRVRCSSAWSAPDLGEAPQSPRLSSHSLSLLSVCSLTLTLALAHTCSLSMPLSQSPTCPSSSAVELLLSRRSGPPGTQAARARSCGAARSSRARAA
jgi:hypothetical protein